MSLNNTTAWRDDVKKLARPLVRIFDDGLAPRQAVGEKLQHGLDSKKHDICRCAADALRMRRGSVDPSYSWTMARRRKAQKSCRNRAVPLV